MDNDEWMVNNNGERTTSSSKKRTFTRHKIKCVVVGDGGTGKTSLLAVYTEGEFPEDYTPTVFENYTTEVHLNGKKFVLMLFDTAGQEDYDRLRPLSYDQADVIIICYDVTSPSSFENVEIRWIPEIHHFCPNAPILLVGCKTDLRNTESTDDVCRDSTNFEKKVDSTNIFVTTHEGERLSKAIKASAFIECSAKKGENVNIVFSTAIEELLKSYSTDEASCSCCIIS